MPASSSISSRGLARPGVRSAVAGFLWTTLSSDDCFIKRCIDGHRGHEERDDGVVGRWQISRDVLPSTIASSSSKAARLDGRDVRTHDDSHPLLERRRRGAAAAAAFAPAAARSSPLVALTPDARCTRPGSFARRRPSNPVEPFPGEGRLRRPSTGHPSPPSHHPVRLPTRSGKWRRPHRPSRRRAWAS